MSEGETTSKLEPSLIVLKALLMERSVHLWGKDKEPICLGEDEDGKTWLALETKISRNGGPYETAYLPEHLDLAGFVRLAEKLPKDYISELAGDNALNAVKGGKG